VWRGRPRPRALKCTPSTLRAQRFTYITSSSLLTTSQQAHIILGASFVRRSASSSRFRYFRVSFRLFQ
jgi:hypothetical protein